MPYSVADTIYDRTHTWMNENDRVAFDRAFAQGPLEEKKMAIAAFTGRWSTPEAVIREELIVHGVPPRYGYNDEPWTIEDMFTGAIPRNAVQGYSGTNGSYTGSDRNVTMNY